MEELQSQFLINAEDNKFIEQEFSKDNLIAHYEDNCFENMKFSKNGWFYRYQKEDFTGYDQEETIRCQFGSWKYSEETKQFTMIFLKIRNDYQLEAFSKIANKPYIMENFDISFKTEQSIPYFEASQYDGYDKLGTMLIGGNKNWRWKKGCSYAEFILGKDFFAEPKERAFNIEQDYYKQEAGNLQFYKDNTFLHQFGLPAAGKKGCVFVTVGKWEYNKEKSQLIYTIEKFAHRYLDPTYDPFRAQEEPYYIDDDTPSDAQTFFKDNIPITLTVEDFKLETLKETIITQNPFTKKKSEKKCWAVK